MTLLTVRAAAWFHVRVDVLVRASAHNPTAASVRGQRTMLLLGAVLMLLRTNHRR